MAPAEQNGKKVYGIKVVCLSALCLSCNINYLPYQSHAWGGPVHWLASRTTDQGVPGSRPGRGTVCCGIEQVTFTHCLVLVKPRKPWTDD